MISYEPVVLTRGSHKRIKKLLDNSLDEYYHDGFIADDPISIPHQFSDKKDIEIIGLWTAILSWGNRKSIIKSSKKLITLMDGHPYDFIVNHKDKDRRRFSDFKHRTFQPADAMYFVHFLQWYYKGHDSLEDLFICNSEAENVIETGLINFQNIFCSLPEFLPRTKKHISSPRSMSTCKRLNMFLRWMVRKDDRGVDFGIWSRIDMADLYIPLDVHVFKVALKLGITTYNRPNWRMVKQITSVLKEFDPDDPIKYDYALFSLGIHS